MFLVFLDNSVKKKYSLEELVNQVDFKLKQNSLDCKYLFTDSL